MKFEVVGSIEDQRTFATGNAIREIGRLRKIYGKARWRKRKGIATVRFADGSTRRAEVHWYEAREFGKLEIKIKHFVD
jgi:hypothetical protein